MKWNDTYAKDIKAKYVYRYLSLEKLIDFLESASLYFARLDRFEDNLEGILPKDVLSLIVRIEEIPAVEDRNPDIPKEKWDDIEHERVEALRLVQNELDRIQKKRYASCWFLGENESLGMWDLYAPSGFLIRFEIKTLQNLIKSKINDQKTNFIQTDLVAVGKVSYEDYDQIFIEQFGEDEELPGFRKHVAFKHEEEYRIIIHTEQTDNIHIDYELGDIEKLNFSLFASPRLSSLSFKTFKSILKNYSKIHELNESNLKKFLKFRDMEINYSINE